MADIPPGSTEQFRQNPVSEENFVFAGFVGNATLKPKTQWVAADAEACRLEMGVAPERSRHRTRGVGFRLSIGVFTSHCKWPSQLSKISHSVELLPGRSSGNLLIPVLHCSP